MPVEAPTKKPKWIPRKEWLKKKHEQGIGSIQYVDYAPYGACREIFSNHDRAVVLAGPAGTGKSRACLEKANWILDKYPGARGMLARMTRRSLTQSGMVTFEKEVLPETSPVKFHSGDQEYRYPNTSILGVAGLDDPTKIFSSQWDFIYVQQAEELEVDDFENLFRGVRNAKVPYQQVFADCNPGPPNHWIKSYAADHRLVLLESRHEDNPTLWDRKLNTWTPFGVKYIANLDALTGVRYKRLRLGIWAGAEGTVYEQSWDPAIHVIPRFEIPKEWPRFWVVDFGYTNPFVWQAWAQDPDGRLYMYREIYKTKTPTEDHAARILSVVQDVKGNWLEPKPKAIICDHDAGERATLERHLNGLKTLPAWKSVSAGIQACESRLKKAGDGKPRIFFLRDSLVDLDRELLDVHHPTSTTGEFESYIWDTSNSKKLGEEPVKKYDHGMDAFRYICAHVDGIARKPNKIFPIISVEREDYSDNVSTSGISNSLRNWGSRGNDSEY